MRFLILQPRSAVRCASCRAALLRGEVRARVRRARGGSGGGGSAACSRRRVHRTRTRTHGTARCTPRRRRRRLRCAAYARQYAVCGEEGSTPRTAAAAGGGAGVVSAVPQGGPRRQERARTLAARRQRLPRAAAHSWRVCGRGAAHGVCWEGCGPRASMISVGSRALTKRSYKTFWCHRLCRAAPQTRSPRTACSTMVRPRWCNAASVLNRCSGARGGGDENCVTHAAPPCRHAPACPGCASRACLLWLPPCTGARAVPLRRQ
jgi:hypothetical protein